ncbi:MAG TPA: DMT family transporter [Gemmatimonadales bacterium]|nr:DMT family transporter [Gemmatimonadales bacterium]
MTHRRAVVGLVVVAAVWGCSFTMIKEVLAGLTPMMLLAARFLLATLLVLPFFRGIGRRELGAGAVVGLLFWIGFVFQTTGLAWTTPSRSAFVTGLSVPLTPLVFYVAHRARPHLPTLAAAALAVAGLYFITRPDAGASVNRGDLLTLGCAVAFAGQIVAGGHFARQVDPRRLLAVEVALTGLLSLALAPRFETPRFELTVTRAALLAFLAVSAVATFGFQLRAQQVVSPSETALIFALEPVFAALTSFVVLGERLGPAQWLGALLILGAMLLPALAQRGRAEAAPLVQQHPQ